MVFETRQEAIRPRLSPLHGYGAATLAKHLIPVITVRADNSNLTFGLISRPETKRADLDNGSVFGDTVYDAAALIASMNDVVFFGVSGCDEGCNSGSHKKAP
jgi:hypothetical protein